MRIVEVTQDSFEEWLGLALELWSDSSLEEMRDILIEILASPRQAGFLVRKNGETAIDPSGNCEAIGFINLSLRQDYVAGASRSPVAYVEGIYVKAEYRRRDCKLDCVKGQK